MTLSDAALRTGNSECISGSTDAQIGIDHDLPAISSQQTPPRQRERHSTIFRSSLAFKRKRNSSEHDYSNSSDPPLFSSDDLQPGAEDYTSKRQKRLYPGTWWAGSFRTEEAELPPVKRSFSRNFDSGVFMASDSSVVDSDDLPNSLPQAKVGADQEPQTRLLTWKTNDPENDSSLQLAQRSASRLVQRCVDDCKCVVDLNSLGLGKIEAETLQPLHYMLQFKQDSPFKPDLQLYLAHNDLTTLPDNLWTLRNITSLSLLANEITQIEPQVGRLINLQQLNISANKLRYLPFSILNVFSRDLHRTESIQEFFTPHYHLKPNPFAEPVTSEAERHPGSNGVGHLQVKAMSTVAYLSIHGAPIRPGQPCPSRQQSNLKAASITQHRPGEESNAPSLFELCLRSAKLSNRARTMLSDVEAAKEIGLVLPTVAAGLERAVQSQAAGPLLCDVCDHEYIIPRAEWLEWWVGIRDNEENLIPLLRRTCSWKCADEARRDVNGLEDKWRNCGWRQPE